MSGRRWVVRRDRMGAQCHDWLRANRSTGEPSRWVPWKGDAGIWDEATARRHADTWGGKAVSRTNRAEAVSRASRAAYLRALEDVRTIMRGRSSIGRSEIEAAIDRLAEEAKR